jgi:glycosyltransferase involved in cell wall biosynthesis
MKSSKPLSILMANGVGIAKMQTNQRTETGTPPSNPELSIIVSCFNQGEILETALRNSFQAIQPWISSFETIVINDGSTDGSVRILDRLRKEFPHLRVTHQLHSGYALSIRRAYDLARGEYLFQIDLEEPEWVKDFRLFWEMRDRYALIIGYQRFEGGRARRFLQWLETRWIKLWFGAELKAPDSGYRLCRRDIATPYLTQIPKDFEGVNLAMTLVLYREAPRLLLEVEVGRGAASTPFSLSEKLGKFLHYFVEIVGLWWKYPNKPVLAPASQSV